ncbi:MAG: tetratricopeptide repeat protein [Nitrospiria bacterium]
MVLVVILMLSSGCVSKSTTLIDNENRFFSSQGVGLTISFPTGWRIAEKERTLFIADFQPGRISLVRLTATEEKGVPALDDYLKITSFQTLSQRMRNVSQGELSNVRVVTSQKIEQKGVAWEETVWLGQRKGQPKIFHTYAFPVELSVTLLHFEFPPAFYNNPKRIIAPVLEGVTIKPVAKRSSEEYAQAYRMVGESYKSLGLWKESIAALKKALSHKSQDADLHVLLGESYLLNEEVDSALHEFLRAVRLAPQNGRAYQGLANVYLKKDRLDEGILAIKRAASFSPNKTALYVLLGDTYLKNGRTEEAIRTFQKVIRQKSGAVEGHLGLGRAYLSIDLYEQAILEFEQALRRRPQLVEPHCLLEKAYTLLDSPEDAEREGKLCRSGKAVAS